MGLHIYNSEQPGFFDNFPELKNLNIFFGGNNYIGVYFGGFTDIELSPKKILDSLFRNYISVKFDVGYQIIELLEKFERGILIRLDADQVNKIDQCVKYGVSSKDLLIELFLESLIRLNYLRSTDDQFIVKYKLLNGRTEHIGYKKIKGSEIVYITNETKKYTIFQRKA